MKEKQFGTNSSILKVPYEAFVQSYGNLQDIHGILKEGLPDDVQTVFWFLDPTLQVVNICMMRKAM